MKHNCKAHVKKHLERAVACFYMLRLLITFLLFCSCALAQLCPNWTETQELGELDLSLLPEASGISGSLLFPERLYHVNDSGRTYHLYITDYQGKNTQSIELDINESDVEDMDRANCDAGSCLFLADIGDNHHRRSVLSLYILPELDVYSEPVSVQTLNVFYPDGPHDTESFAMQPNGDIYILTKEPLNILRTSPARLYRLDYATWSQDTSITHTLEYVLSIDFFDLSNFSIDVLSHLATSMDFSEDGERLLVLTYGNAYEFAFSDLLAGQLNYQVVNLNRSFQQEAISYVNNDKAFLYTAEGRSGRSPIKRYLCLQ